MQPYTGVPTQGLRGKTVITMHGPGIYPLYVRG